MSNVKYMSSQVLKNLDEARKIIEILPEGTPLQGYILHLVENTITILRYIEKTSDVVQTPNVHINICSDVSAQTRRAVLDMLPEIKKAVTGADEGRMRS